MYPPRLELQERQSTRSFPSGLPPLAIRSRIHRALEEMMERYDVAAVHCDRWKWQDELVEWDGRWPNRIVEVPTNSVRRMPEVVDRFRSALEEGSITRSGDPDLRRHVLNARLRKVGRDEDGRGRYSLEKAGPGRLIDACVAATLAYEGAVVSGPGAFVLVI